MKKRLTFLAILIAILAVIISSVVYAAPSVTITNPPDNGFYLQASSSYPSTLFRANVSGNPTSVTATYLCRTNRDNNTYTEYSIGNLTREGSSNYYSKSVSFNYWYWPRLASIAPSLGVIKPQIKITATDATGSTSVTRFGAICRNTKEGYQSTDPAFSYTNENNNNFLGTATGHPYYDGVSIYWTYNCMAYALYQVSGGWLWPWAGNPSEPQLTSTMSSYGYQKLSSPAYAQVIYYANGHFSRVFSWNATTHYPEIIYSKWGGLELIKSSSYNPFTSGSYGNALYYYKQP